MKFVFRNNTIENFLTKDCICSGYDDISYIPEDAEGYIWWYQLPVKYDQAALADEVSSYGPKLQYVAQNIAPGKMLVALTMDVLYNVPFCDDDCRVARAVDEYNASLYELSQSCGNIKVIDIRDFTREYSAEELIDWKYYFISQMPFNPKLARPFKKWMAHKMDGLALKRKKCLVLDLDNTLWGGVLGEDGIDGIQIGGDYPGKAFLYFQSALLQLAKTGVILTVCSKNNENDVLEAWEKNPFNVLKKEHFSAWRINWNDKPANIRELAEELNIGIDSFVFVDDNPAERELVRQTLPMVSVPDFPEHPYMLPAFFKQLVSDYFKVYTVTPEDLQKTEQYKANALRRKEQLSFTNMEAFLRSLDLQVNIQHLNEHNLARIAQMTQKTNQFNLTTRRYTETDIRRQHENGWHTWCVSVKDKFGDNGITGCIIVDNHNHIDSFLLSCRILGKGIETAFAKSVFSLLKKQGVETITATYAPTAKNIQVADFYDRCGMELLETDQATGLKHYRLSLASADLTVQDLYHINIE